MSAIIATNPMTDTPLDRLRRQSLTVVARFDPAMSDDEIVDGWIQEAHRYRSQMLLTGANARRVATRWAALRPQLTLFATTVCPDEWAHFTTELTALLEEIDQNETAHRQDRPAIYRHRQETPHD